MRLEGVQMGTVYPIKQKAGGQGSQNKITENEKNMKKGEKGVGEVLPGERVIPEEQLIHAVDRANKSFQPFDRRFEISIHEKTRSVMIKVINSINDEVIREIPPEKVLDMVAHMLEVAGIIVDERV
ncbi:MAG TPA: flagellar protein FlaG [Oscillospiraceae bacterium]|nr:flagellar protein FlaG [Oscillospiraceae bacterium]